MHGPPSEGNAPDVEWLPGRAHRAVLIRNGLYVLLSLCALPFVATAVLARDALGMFVGLTMSVALALTAAFPAVAAWRFYKSALAAPEVIGVSHDTVVFRFGNRQEVIAFSDVRSFKARVGKLDSVRVEFASGPARSYPGIGYAASKAIVMAWEVWKQDRALAGASADGVRIAGVVAESLDDTSAAGFALMGDGRLVPDLVWHGARDGAARPDAPGRWVSLPASQLRMEAVIYAGLLATGVMFTVMFGAIGTRTIATLRGELFLGAPAATFLVGLLLWRHALLGGAARAELMTEAVLGREEGGGVLREACRIAGLEVRRSRWAPLGFRLETGGALRLGFWRGGQPKLMSVVRAQMTRPGYAREFARLKGAVLEVLAVRGIDGLEDE